MEKAELWWPAGHRSGAALAAPVSVRGGGRQGKSRDSFSFCWLLMGELRVSHVRQASHH